MTKEKKARAKHPKIHAKVKEVKGIAPTVVATRSLEARAKRALLDNERNGDSVPKKTHQSVLTKSHIPKKVRTDVWNTFIGPNIPIHKCLCCLKATICMTDFQVGHVVSEHDGGNLNIDNLRPICASCNISMGTTNMKDYVVKYGYLI